jgi:hypothetical protein
MPRIVAIVEAFSTIKLLVIETRALVTSNSAVYFENVLDLEILMIKKA